MLFPRLLLTASIFTFARSAPTAAVHGVRLLGRVNPQTSELTWPATGVPFEFTGTCATIAFSQITGTNSADLVIDNGSPLVITEVNSTHILTPTLSQGRHSIQLYKRSEALYGSLFFGNVSVSGGLSDPTTLSRRIEFIGDSITVGYGEATTLPCMNSAEVEDAYDTYGSLTARNFSAEYSFIA